MQRVTSMYTNWNLMGVAASPWLPEPVTDIIRASSLLILVVMATLWVKEDMIRIYGEVVDTFLPIAHLRCLPKVALCTLPKVALCTLPKVAPCALPRVVKIEIAFLFDIILHVGPVLLLGLPTNGLSFIYAAALLGIWYAWARNKIGWIYAPSIEGPKADRGVAVALLSALLFAVFSALL